ncbi:hypothetical protein TWF281_009795 [Arthrobotrys megalospora]
MLSTFATELLTHIFSFLPWQDHINASQVCRRWSSIILSPPTQSNRYILLNPQRTPCPRMHNLFSEIGLECTINVFTGYVSKITFIRGEKDISTDEEREIATVDITNHEILKEPLLHFQGWRYQDDIREGEWRMAILMMWNQKGYEYGGRDHRQFYRQDWFSFVKREVGELEKGGGNDIRQGEVNLDISVRGFISVLAKHVIGFDALKLPGRQEMKLRFGMYDKMGVVVVRNVHEDPWASSLGSDLSDKGYNDVDKEKNWVHD